MRHDVSVMVTQRVIAGFALALALILALVAVVHGRDGLELVSWLAGIGSFVLTVVTALGAVPSRGAQSQVDTSRIGSVSVGGPDIAGRLSWFRTHRTVLTALVAIVVSAAVGAAFTLAIVSGEDTDGTAAPPGSSSTSAPTGADGEAAGSAAAQLPAVQWEGPLVLDGGGKDLDGSLPAESTGDNDISTSGVSDDYQVNGLGNALVALWGADGGMPEYADCAGTVDAAGTHSEPLEVGTVICLRTGEGRIGRLEVNEFPREYGPVVRFEITVWALPSNSG